MPRPLNPDLEKQILDAAHELWRRGGEEALTLRAVALAAGSNTPAVYRRFKNRKEILRALVHRIQGEVHAVIEPCTSLQEIADAFLDFALSHPREYELGMNGVVTGVSEVRPNLEFVLQRAAEWLGGEPEGHESLVFAVWALAHGTASMLNSKSLSRGHAAKMRAAFRPAVNALIVRMKHAASA